MQRYRVNLPLLIGIVVGSLALVAGGFGLFKVQQARNAGRLIERAEEAREAGELVEAAKFYSQYLAVKKDDKVMAELANVYADIADAPKVEPKDIRTAMGLLESTVREQPDNQTLRRRLVDLLMSPRVRMLKPALDHISQLLNQTPGDKELELMRSECLFATADPKAVDHAYKLVGYDASSEEFDAEKALAPGEPIIYARLASTLRGERNDERLAEKVIAQMVKANPESGVAALYEAQHLELTDRSDEAKERVREGIQRALELAPDDMQVVMAAARVESQQAFNLVKTDFPDEEAYKKAYDERLEQGRALLREAIAKHPEEAELYQTLAGLTIRAGDLDLALQRYDEGIAAVPPDRAAMLWFYKARLLVESGKTAEAKAAIKQMREDEFIPPPFLDYIGARLAMSESRWFDAAKEFERLQGFMANLPEMNVELNYLLAFCYEKLGQFEKSLATYDVVLQANPNNKMAAYGRTRAQSAMGRIGPQSDGVTIYTALQEELDKPKRQQDWVAFQAKVDTYIDQLELGQAMKAVLEGEVLMRREKYPEARAKLLESYRLDPKNLGVRRAAVKLFASDPEQGPVKALKLLDKVVEDFGDKAILRLERADLLIAINDEGLVDQLYDLTRGMEEWSNEDQVQVWSGLASRFGQLSDRAAQVDALRKVAKLTPGDLPSLEQLFLIARDSNDEAGMQDAQERILKVVGSKDDPVYLLTEAYRLLTKVAGRRDQTALLDEADAILDKAMVARPEWNQLYQARASVALLRNDEPLALASLDRAAELGRPSTLSLYQHVKLLARRGRHADLLAQLDKVAPEARERLVGRDYAEALLISNRATEGVAVAGRLAEAAANDSGVQLWRGQYLDRAATLPEFPEERRAAMQQEAGETLQKAVQINPNAAEAWLALINHQVNVGDRKEAEQTVREAQLVLPEDQTVLMFARCYEVIGRWMDAEALFKQAVDRATLDEESAKADGGRALRMLAGYYLGPVYPGAKKSEKAVPLINRLLKQVVDGQLEAYNANAQWARSTAARVLASSGDYQALRKAEQLLSSNVIDGELAADDRLLMTEILGPRPEPVSRQKAVSLLESLREGRKLPLQTDLTLGRLYYSLGEWRKCREQMIDLISQHPDDPIIRITYLRMLLERGGPADIDQAIPQLNRLTQVAPNDVNTRELVARVALKRGKTREAIASLRGMLPEDLTTLKSEQLPLVQRVAELLTEFEDFDRAEPLYKLLADKGGSDGVLAYADFLGRHRDVTKGLDMIETTRDKATDVALVQSGLGILRTPEAEADVEKHAARVQGWLDSVFRENPESIPLRLQQAEMMEIRRDYPAAAELYRKLLEGNELVGSSRAIVLNNLAYLLALTSEESSDIGEARRYIDEAVELLGPQTDVLDTRAVVAISAKDYEGAIQDLTLAVIDKPTASKFFHKAVAHLLMGQNQQATEAWQRAVEMGLRRDTLSQLERAQFDKASAELGGAGPLSSRL